MKNQFRSDLLQNFSNQMRIFERQIASTHRKHTNKNIHQLRITTRRIRAVLWLVKHGVPHLSFETLNSDLRKLSQALGFVRELDVAIQDAKEFRLQTKKLKKRRRSARKNLFELTDDRHRRKMIRRLHKAFIEIQRHQEQTLAPGMNLLKHKLLPWTRKFLTTQDDFHKVRIITKKTRYILEIIGKPSQPLCELQDVLGKGHDLEVLQDYVKASPQVHEAAKEHYQKGLRMIRPTLRFALRQL